MYEKTSNELRIYEIRNVPLQDIARKKQKDDNTYALDLNKI